MIHFALSVVAVFLSGATFGFLAGSLSERRHARVHEPRAPEPVDRASVYRSNARPDVRPAPVLPDPAHTVHDEPPGWGGCGCDECELQRRRDAVRTPLRIPKMSGGKTVQC